MSARQCLTVLAIAALAASSAAARPGAGANDIHIEAKSDVPNKSVVAPKPDAAMEVKPVNKRFPHAVNLVPTCGGTIISPTWVLTVGQCMLSSTLMFSPEVLAGTNQRDYVTGVHRRVKRLVIHPLFSIGPYWLDADKFDIKQVATRWDFLLVELNEALPLDGKTMAAAKLDERLSLPEGLHASYAGFGNDDFGAPLHSEMRNTEVAVQSDERCSTLQQYNAKDMLCAEGRPPQGVSACDGDGGSGLVDESGNLVGMLSWAGNDAHPCSNGTLLVFARVAAVRDWIRQVAKV